MDLEQIYFISEIVAALAVIGSLIYVAIQLRQNTTTVRIAAGQAHVDAYDNLISKLLESDGLTELWVKADKGIADLNAVEQTQVLAFVGVMFRNFEGAYIQWHEGVLDERFWQGIFRSMAEQYSSQAVQVFWGMRRSWYSDEFGAWFDENVVAKAAASTEPKM